MVAQNIPPPSIVYTAHDPAAIKEYRTDPAVVRGMVNRLVLAVTGQPDLAKAWGSLVSPNDKVGIKISAAGGELFTTHRDIVNAIVDGLVAAGHSRNRQSSSGTAASEESRKPATGRTSEGYQIEIDRAPRRLRSQSHLQRAAHRQVDLGRLEYRSDRGKIPLLSDQELTSDDSHFARIVSSEVTKIINVPVMSDSASCRARRLPV